MPASGGGAGDVFLWPEDIGRRCCHGRALLGGVVEELGADMIDSRNGSHDSEGDCYQAALRARDWSDFR